MEYFEGVIEYLVKESGGDSDQLVRYKKQQKYRVYLKEGNFKLLYEEGKNRVYSISIFNGNNCKRYEIFHEDKVIAYWDYTVFQKLENTKLILLPNEIKMLEYNCKGIQRNYSDERHTQIFYTEELIVPFITPNYSPDFITSIDSNHNYINLYWKILGADNYEREYRVVNIQKKQLSNKLFSIEKWNQYKIMSFEEYWKWQNILFEERKRKRDEETRIRNEELYIPFLKQWFNRELTVDELINPQNTLIRLFNNGDDEEKRKISKEFLSFCGKHPK